MIISHTLKVAYFRVPKTGSSTVEILLRMAGVARQDICCTPEMSIGLPAHNIPENVIAKLSTGQGHLEHMTPTDAVNHGLITKAQLTKYRCFATLRNPVDRWRSIMAHAGLTEINESIALLKTGKELVVIDRPQTDYFFVDGEQVCEPIWQKNLNDELPKIFDAFGVELPYEIPQLNVNPKINRKRRANELVPPEVREHFKNRYGHDMKFYKSLKEQSDIESD